MQLTLITHGVAVGLAVALTWGYLDARHAAALGEIRVDQANAEVAAHKQKDENVTRAAEVEQRVVTQTVYRDRFITKTVKEIERVTEPMAACLVPADAVRLLNDAARCAREDQPAACGADDAVRDAG
ncbi:MAG: hypothetical protein QM777_09005 [Pseudorhodoferax sp.]